MSVDGPRSTRRRSRFSDLPIGAKTFALLAVVMGLFAASSLLFLRNQNDIREARHWTDHTHEVLAAAYTLQRHIPEQLASLRGYAIHRDPAFLEELRRHTKDIDSDLRTLLALTADNAEQQGRLRSLAELVREWQQGFIEVELDLAADPARHEELIALVQSGRGRALSKDLQQHVAEVLNVENALLVLRNETLTAGLRRIRLLAIASLAAGLSFSLLALFAVQRTLATPLYRLRMLIDRLSDGDLAIAVPYTARGDEIGSIARAIEAFRKASLEVQRREWLKRHLAELGATLSQQRDYEHFGRALLAYLCPLVGAAYGMLLRVHPDGGLEPIGDYGYKERRNPPRRAQGGLVAECMRSRRPILLSPLPDDYIRVASGLGEARAHSAYLCPLPGTSGVVGVLEIAALAPFEAQALELVEEAARVNGLALESLANAIRTHELLDETRAQAEELQASEETLRIQQEELRATNEALGAKNSALEEQGRRLRASEEELRAQTEALRESNDALGEKSRALNEFNERLLGFQQALEIKNSDLEQASRYKSEFLANMSHELRTPLNSVLILAKDLADNSSGNLSAEQVESAQIIHDSGRNLLELINDILDLSKIEAGRMDVEWEDVDLPDWTAGIERSFRRLARERGLDFSVELAPDLPALIRSDGAKLTQILTNLLGNAFKFTHQGGVRLRIARPDDALALPETAARGRTIAMTVRDTGIGIDERKLSRLFQPFEQGDGTTSRRYGGTGLGLAISRSLAQMLGGDIAVRSRPGEGSSFTLWIPQDGERAGPDGASTAAPEPEAAPAAPPAEAPAASSGPAARTAAAAADDRDALRPGDTSILIVEDDGAFARVLADMARRKGHRVLVAGDGETALQLARRYQPSGILLDVDLPVRSGWSVIEALKADPATHDIAVHFVTGNDERARGMAMGAAGFLIKPATREALDAAFERLLPAGDGRRRRLLVIEDDAGARHAIARLLAGEAVDIEEADTAAAGLQRLAAQAYDCVILDLTLPDASGFEVLEQLAARGPLPPVVIYSARELSRDENLRLRQYTDSIVIKGAQSPGRLLDEVSLFLHAVRRPSSPKPTAQQPSDLAGRTVLVVDDDMRNVFALSKTLRHHGLNVLVAQDGERALEQLERHPEIRWVLMDVMMPGMDGYEAMRRIRERSQWRDLPLIAVTAKAMKGDREKCLEAGASDYLTKPIDLDRLLSLLRAWQPRH